MMEPPIDSQQIPTHPQRPKAKRVKLARKVQRAAEGTIAAMLGGSLSLVFNAWKMMKMSDFQMIQAKIPDENRVSVAVFRMVSVFLLTVEFANGF